MNQHDQFEQEKDFIPVTEIKTPDDAQKAWLQNTLDLVLYAFESGCSYSDAESIVAIVKGKLPFVAESVDAFLTRAKIDIDRQVEVNQKFIEMYSKKQSLMRAGVKSGLGSLAKSSEFDKESLEADGWAYLLKRMADGSYEWRSEKEENAFIRSCGKNTARKAVLYYQRHLKHARDPNFEHGMGEGAWAKEFEDLNEVSPGPTRKNATVD